MECKINANGELIIQADTGAEVYALKQWMNHHVPNNDSRKYLQLLPPKDTKKKK